VTEYLTASELASYLDTNVSGALERIVVMTNALIDEKWADPVDPIPASVTNMAWRVAVRVGANPKGLSSWTRNWDDISRTERMEHARAAGVIMSDDEVLELNGLARTRVVKSIRMRIPGWC
jgi:hypothetical protein